VSCLRARARLAAILISVCGLATLTAQTPAPSSSPAKPLRHLEYSFSVAVQGLQGYRFDAAHGTGLATVDRFGNVADPEGGSGTMLVDVMSIAKDGALVVRIAELVRGDPRPRQAYTCTVYGDTTVACNSVPSPSEAEWVLLGYLGRQFIDNAPWDSQGHWQHTLHTPQYSLQENFTLVDAKNDRDIVVHESKKMTLSDVNLEQQTSEVAIDYDRTMEVPDVIRDEVSASSDIEGSHASYLFALVRDSFAKPR
jgi:hypothetical protein